MLVLMLPRSLYHNMHCRQFSEKQRGIFQETIDKAEKDEADLAKYGVWYWLLWSDINAVFFRGLFSLH